METETYLGRAKYLKQHMSREQPNKELLGNVWAWLSVGSGIICQTKPELLTKSEDFVERYFHAMNSPLSEEELREYHTEAAAILEDLFSGEETSSTAPCEDSRELVSAF